MISAGDCTGVVLAGGRSSRMGRDKALLSISGVSFLHRVTATLRQVLPGVVIISDRESEHRIPGFTVYRDLLPDCGPLGGIHTALSKSTRPYAFVLSCDVPFASADLLREILDRARPGEVTIAGDGLDVHPLLGIYPASLLPLLEEDLKAGRKKVGAFLARPDVPLAVLPLSHRSHELRNINTPEDFSGLSG